ncbi:DNA-binding FadR family transcriptional regulator [Lipingzhangella halophila]|uniref:DNA-binding FadR family transcriptional regulator n=1 Tax=Lipingzhangella halophila TaxID=1783352 RepID=A0A7W7RMS1_9ACTN|nr:FadR/GntR family transcriptional regulator [Lipingzhangella halophila]MBB4934878.1 DNA-binding FadR family transcriptional regulator [Lipingzhangella halophila]
MARNDASAPKSRGTDDLFSRVHLGRASQVIVDQVRMLLRDDKLKPGDRLPSERELCERFGVSRVTVREALRVLEASGLVEIRVGAHGGAFVTTPSNERVGESLADLITLSPLTASQVTEARIVFELGIIPLVVERATAEDIADLRALVTQGQQALDEDSYTMEMSAAFHVRFAACTHNAAIETLVQSFHGPMLLSLQKARDVAPLMGHRGAAEHADLVTAVEHRDVEKARFIMRQHLQRTAQRLENVATDSDSAEGAAEDATE